MTFSQCPSLTTRVGEKPVVRVKAMAATLRGKRAAASRAPGSEVPPWLWKWALGAVGASAPRTEESDPRQGLAGHAGWCAHRQGPGSLAQAHVMPSGAPRGGLCLSCSCIVCRGQKMGGRDPIARSQQHQFLFSSLFLLYATSAVISPRSPWLPPTASLTRLGLGLDDQGQVWVLGVG